MQDAIEQDRLVAQHYLLRTAFATRSPQMSPTSFSPEQHSHQSPVVLDVGCGLGQWCMEMATTYPHSTFIGIDLLPSYPKDIKPRNCHFRQVNVRHLPLPFQDHSIDFIFQRDLNWGLAQDEWHPLIMEYLRILKPGGWIELVEPDLETKSSLEKECAMNDKLLQGFRMRQQDPYAARKLPTILAVHGFRRVESHFQSLPLGWERLTNSKKQSQAMASQYLFYLRSLGPWLRRVMGFSQAKYVEYVDQLPSEWEQAKTYVNWHCATAQKPYES
ncbi:S-adenosyl-L-methionine-dependent methyltransferase [Halteromyces radiatus]|uniref:S-adenosyl-L-methionine-dependent methyltransferase n=1 Tax=Halteromyces radiatus TaxID=101107 RepID=UPI00221EE679|nr:S-adenosyl-L-methionine-dependent methyltransferase [Halteromyces radiatus]KAI8079776.1 S-adenosyl-L-methionine-dependent methyltransferase [Halteromyces radiatus]